MDRISNIYMFPRKDQLSSEIVGVFYQFGTLTMSQDSKNSYHPGTPNPYNNSFLDIAHLSKVTQVWHQHRSCDFCKKDQTYNNIENMQPPKRNVSL